VAGGTAPLEHPGVAEHQHAVADGDEGRALVGLLPDPAQQRRVVAVVHRRHDHVVGAFGVAAVEGVDIGIGQQAQRRHHLHHPGARGERDDLGHPGPGKQSVGDDVIHQLGHAVLADHRHQRAFAVEALRVGGEPVGIFSGEQGQGVAKGESGEQ